MCLISLRKKDDTGRVYEMDYSIEWVSVDKIKIREIGGTECRTHKLYRGLKGFYIKSDRLKTYISSAIKEYLSLFK